MQTTRLGRTGLEVSRLCLGTMNFGPQTSEADSHRIMDAALERDVYFFDTSNNYGMQWGDGVTEGIIGNWIAKGNGRREKTVLATKVYNPLLGYTENAKGLSARNIKRNCEASLKRLKTDYIDLYQMHHVHRETPWEEIWQAMEQLIREGKILYVGTSNFAGWHIVDGQHHAEKRNLLGLVSEQCHYNLQQRSVETDVLPACQAKGIGILPWSPLAGGVLGGALQKQEKGRRADMQKQQYIETLRPQLERWEGFCRDLGHDPSEVALAWLLHQPAVTAPIIGPRTVEQLDSNLRSLEIRFTAEQLSTIDQIWPGPGAQAPEVFAW